MLKLNFGQLATAVVAGLIVAGIVHFVIRPRTGANDDNGGS